VHAHVLPIRSALRYVCVVRALAVLGLVVACRSEAPAPKPTGQGSEHQVDENVETPEARARALIEALVRGDSEPLAALITPESTWDGATATGAKAANFTTPEDIAAAGRAPRELVGDFQRIGFVWTEGDYVFVLTEHAAGDFVFMVRFDAKQRLSHLTFTPPDELPRSGCSAGASRLLDDGSIFVGPTQETVPSVAIVGTLGSTGVYRSHDLAAGLSCKGIASILVPASKPFEQPAPSVRLVVAHTRDGALIPPGIEQLLFDQFLPKPNRESGRKVIDSSHVAQSVIDQVAARASVKK
jgi:hypothetical protein